MGIEIYKGIEHAIERACNEQAEKLVSKEMAPYRGLIDAYANDASSKAFYAFRREAVKHRTHELVVAVTNSCHEVVTAHLKTILNSKKGN